MKAAFPNVKQPMKEALQHLRDAEVYLGSIQQGDKDPTLVKKVAESVGKSVQAIYTELELRDGETTKLAERVANIELKLKHPDED